MINEGAKIAMDGLKNPAQTNPPLNNPRSTLRRIGLLPFIRVMLARIPNAAPNVIPVRTWRAQAKG